MVDLPSVPRRMALTEAPRNGISAADIAAPYAMFARAAGNLADVVAPMAEDAAMAAGASAVGRDENGNLTMVAGPAVGRLGQIYTRAARSTYLAQVDGEIDRKLMDLRQQHQNDPQGFDVAAKAYVRELRLNQPDAVLRESVGTMAQKGADQHFLGMSRARQEIDLGNAKLALETRVKATDDKMAALARQGGTGTAEYRALQADMRALYGELGANPAWGYNPTVVEDRIGRGEARHRSEAIIGMSDRIYDERGHEEAVKWVESEVRDPALSLSEAERNQYVSQAKAHIGVREAMRKEDVREVRAFAQPVISGLYAGDDLEADGEMLRQKSLAMGDTIGAARIMHAMEFRRGKNGDLSVPTRQWSEERATGPVAQKVAAAATAAGLPLNIIMPVIAQESGFDPARRPIGKDGAPLSSALGIGQLLKAEREAAGIGDSTDPDAQIPVVMRKLHGVYATTKAALGREPTAGEFYVVYYQGEGAGPKILANPAGDFAATVGERVLTANPWLRGLKTNADFVAWSERKMGERGATGVPPSQIAGYRQYAATTFDAYMADARKTLGKWRASDADMAFLAGDIFPFLDPRRRREAAVFMGEAERAGALLAITPQARQAVQTSLENAAAGGDLAARAVLAREGAAFAELQQMENETPLLRALRGGWIKELPPPVPWQGSDEEVVAAMQARSRAAMIATNQIGRPVTAFEGADLRALTGALDAADVSGKVRILGALATLPPGVREATLGALHQTGAKGAVLAYAGALAGAAPDVAAGIVRGGEALVVEPRFVPDKGDEGEAFLTAMDKELPATAFAARLGVMASGPYATMRAAVKARYADLAAGVGDTSGKLNRDRLDRAVEEVTGGTVRHNGATILAPRRGMDQRAFDAVLYSLTNDDLAGVRTLDGRTITADYLRNSATLESFGSGRYLVRLNRNAENPQYAILENGAPFVLRLDDKAPAAARAAPLDLSGVMR